MRHGRGHFDHVAAVLDLLLTDFVLLSGFVTDLGVALARGVDHLLSSCLAARLSGQKQMVAPENLVLVACRSCHPLGHLWNTPVPWCHAQMVGVACALALGDSFERRCIGDGVLHLQRQRLIFQPCAPAL